MFKDLKTHPKYEEHGWEHCSYLGTLSKQRKPVQEKRRVLHETVVHFWPIFAL